MDPMSNMDGVCESDNPFPVDHDGKPRPIQSICFSWNHQLFQVCRKIRIEIFVKEQGFDLEDEFDEIDKYAVHFLFSLEKKPKEKFIGVLRYDPRKGKIGRIGVIEEYRGVGIGTKMLEIFERNLIENRFMDLIGHDELDGFMASNSSQTSHHLTTAITSNELSSSLIDTNLLAQPGPACHVDSSNPSLQLRLHSQIQAIGFYSKLGYRTDGETFLVFRLDPPFSIFSLASSWM